MNSSNDPEINPYSAPKVFSATPLPADRKAATPTWGYVFFIACMAIMVATRGGAIWGALGGAIGALCLKISQNQEMGAPLRIAICAVITAALWGCILALLAGQVH